MADPKDEKSRPSPDALLELARKEQPGRGRLKIFLGAAPGVGKTYEMLLSGRARLADGDDVVIGVVETHGRPETEALVRGFEIVPRRHFDYKGRMIQEMDLDALLARRPQLALVDELAHTNAPGSRHPKRYLDVEELLAAGIDVYTTLNIQHVESLNDVVAQITRIRVRETVPDSVLDGADDIEVIDLAPERTDAAAPRGQGVCAQTGAAGAQSLFLAGQSDRAARACAPPHRAARRRAAPHPYARARHRRTLAGRRARARLRQRGPARRRARPLHQAARRPAARALDRALYRNAPQPRSVRRRARPRRRYAAACRAPRRRCRDHPRRRTHRRRYHGVSRAPTTSRRSSSASRRGRRWFELLNGSVVHDLVRRSGNISVHVIAGDNLGPRRFRERPSRRRPRRGCRGCWRYGAGLGATVLALAAAKLSEPYFGPRPCPSSF